ncbi:MAG: division plane positioning ATPase MipZ [Sulfurimonas sp.]|uniref:nucleotide-binding protein n=1 Tax=Sulfurimonas sp. TaxID=2022749 RepID=UPI0028CE06FA|nr:division plane positioning ATPase MipZ [Sulfurimonas sp.]MDT8339136.1 division plane positioning ATPase MipZ [Sulfurimonas sp.]
MTILILNTKGGSGKSTTALQVASTFFLAQSELVELCELDNQNQDAAAFTATTVKTRQVQVEVNAKDLNATVRDLFINSSVNSVIDVGGNETTSKFILSLKQTNMYKLVNLIIIPISSGAQDFINAKRTLELVHEFDIPVIFSLTRSRHGRDSKRLQFQYSAFFEEFGSKYPYFVLVDSDVVDLSRRLKKTIYEIASDDQLKKELEELLDAAFVTMDRPAIYSHSLTLEILGDSKVFTEECILPAHSIIAKAFKNE